MLWLLCAAVSEIRSMRYELSSLRQSQPEPKPPHPVFDGMLESLRILQGDELLSVDYDRLSVRAIKALCRGNFRFKSELTPDALYRIPNCGTTTINEIMAWKENGHAHTDTTEATA